MSTLKSSAEDLTLNADGSGNDIKFQSNAVEVGELTDGGVLSSTGGSTHADNVKAKFGTGNDLEIYHDASHSFISDQGTGSLKILANTLEINNAANNEAMAGFTQDGAVTLYHNDAAKFETIAGGCRIPSGGLLFGSDTVAANALDDYEEGTWTPIISDGTNNATGYSHQHGHYRKVGGLVHINGFIVLTNLGSVSGAVRISGLPFASANAHNNYGSMSFSRCDGLAIQDGGGISGYIVQGQAYAHLYLWDETTGNSTLSSGELSADGLLTFAGTYAA